MTMKSIAKYVVPVAFAFALLMALTANAASEQGKHPAYLHFLTGLRAARAHLERSGGEELHEEEKEAIHQIDEAINEIKRASRRQCFRAGLQQRSIGHIDKTIHEVDDAMRIATSHR